MLWDTANGHKGEPDSNGPKCDHIAIVMCLWLLEIWNQILSSSGEVFHNFKWSLNNWSLSKDYLDYNW